MFKMDITYHDENQKKLKAHIYVILKINWRMEHFACELKLEKYCIHVYVCACYPMLNINLPTWDYNWSKE